MFYFLRLNVSSKCVVFLLLLKNFFLTLNQTFFCLFYHLHHPIDFRDQNVLLLLFGLSILVFALYFLIFKLTNFTLQNLVSLVNFGSLFFCLLILLFKGLKFVLVFLLLLLGFFKFQAFRVELQLYLFGLLLDLSFFRLVKHQSLMHLVKLILEQIASDTKVIVLF